MFASSCQIGNVINYEIRVSDQVKFLHMKDKSYVQDITTKRTSFANS